MLDALTRDERAQVPDSLAAERPDLIADAERLAAELLSSASSDAVADDVEAALVGIPLGALGARAGRVRGGGYVDEADAAWELVDEAITTFRSDLERRASLGLVEAAAMLAAGVVSGLYRAREPKTGTVLARAGDDAPGELAGGVLELVSRLGVEVLSCAGDEHWPDWTDLP